MLDNLVFLVFSKIKLQLKYFILILLSWTVPIVASAQFDYELTFQDMDKLGLLPDNFISAMEMDDHGVLWIATNDGLCRYDSPNSVSVFRKGDIGIESDIIRTLENGSDSTLWIGTTFGGVTSYNYFTDESKTYLDTGSGSNRLSDNEILSLAEVSPEEIWIGSERGLDVLFPAEDSIYSFNSANNSGTMIEGSILNIFVDQRSWIWISTWGHGLYLYLPDPSGRHDRGSFRQILIPGFDGASNIWDIEQHDSHHYWLATHNGGLGYMSVPDGGSIAQNKQEWSPKFEFYTTKETNLTLNYLTDLAYDNDNNLWISTNNGLNILTKEQIDSIEWKKPDSQNTIKFYSYYHRPQITTSLNNNNITSLLVDKQGLVWIGSSSGINQYNELNNRFRPELLKDIVGKEYVSSDRVNVMTMIDQTTLLLGTSENGLITYDVSTKQSATPPPFLPRFGNSRITSLYRHGDQELYIGTETGVFRISLSAPYSIVEYDLVNESGLPQDRKAAFFVTAILRDSEDRLWAGSESGLFLIDESANTWRKRDIDGSVTKLFEDSENNIWYTSYRGVNRISAGDDIDQMTTYMNGQSEETEAISSNHVFNVAEYKERLYFGSVRGLFVYDLKEQKFKDFDDPDIHTVINNLAISPQGILWTSSTTGITRYDLNTGIYKVFAERDGIQLSTIRSDACLLGPDGQVYFGCHGGFLSIDDSDWDEGTIMPEVYITQVSATNDKGDVKVYRSLNQEHIEIAPNEYAVEINFFSNNYSHPRANTFAHRLEGFQNADWYYTTDEKISYTNLDPGEYEFHIKTADVDGVWPEDYQSLKLTVKAKFIETTLFKVLTFLGVIALMYLITTSLVRATRKRNNLLNEYNQTLEKRDVQMQELVGKLDKSNKDLTRSNKELAQYAYITSHDLQEPLRTVGAFAGLLKLKTEQINDPEIKEISEFIQDGVARMSSLIKSLLGYSLIDKGADHFERVDLNELVRGKILGLNEYIKQRNAEVIIDQLPTIVCLKEQIGTVFYNLILNGIKFNKSAKPTVTIDVSEHDEHWQFNVSDNGIGIPEEYQKKIFEIFTRLHLKEEYEGTGIGLAICNKIIGNHQGTISLKSNEEEGSRFSFTVSKGLSLSATKLSEAS